MESIQTGVIADRLLAGKHYPPWSAMPPQHFSGDRLLFQSPGQRGVSGRRSFGHHMGETHTIGADGQLSVGTVRISSELGRCHAGANA